MASGLTQGYASTICDTITSGWYAAAVTTVPSASSAGTEAGSRVAATVGSASNGTATNAAVINFGVLNAGSSTTVKGVDFYSASTAGTRRAFATTGDIVVPAGQVLIIQASGLSITVA